MPEQKFLSYRDSTIAYLRFGHGPQTAICFHGYGEDGTSFAFLEKYAGEVYTFYAIDLPFHGQTDWKNGYDFTSIDLSTIIENILPEADRSAKTKITVIGFSIGGRVALSYFQDQPQKINNLLLLAPDGLKVNFWYWAATQTGWGNRVFSFTMKHPGWFFGFLRLINKLRLVNASIFKFVTYYIGDGRVRQLLYDRWTSLRKLKPNIPKIKTAIIENDTAVQILYGRHDRIILSSVGERFKKGIEKQCTIRIIAAGHQVLHEKHISEILPALLARTPQ